MQKLSEFSKIRNADRSAVSGYIKRHADDFKGHTIQKGKYLMLDDVAIELLDKQYPLPKPIEVIEDTAARNALIQAQQKIIALQNENAQLQIALNDSKNQQLLIEMKSKQSEERIKQLEDSLKNTKEEQEKTIDEAIEKEVERRKATVGALEKIIDLEAEKIKKLSEELEIERNKSWWEKLWGK